MKPNRNRPTGLRTRIVHITFDMGIGGAEQVIYNLVRHTDSSRYDVSVLCLNEPLGPFGMALEKQGYEIHPLDRKPGFDWSLVRGIRRFVIANEVRVLHCHQYTPYVYGLLGAVLTGCKVIFTEHGRFYPDRRKWKRVLVNPLLNQFTDFITAISAATREALVLFENFPRRKIKVVYNGIDDSRFILPQEEGLKESLGIARDAHIIGTVARLDPIKNHPLMIKALKIVLEHFPGTVLVIVGDGPERAKLEVLTRELGLSSQVIFTGFREDTHLYYRIIDIFLLTSFSEGTAMTLLEAMAGSLPCIATDAGGNTEVVRDGETGFIILNNDEKALAEKVCNLLADEPLRRKMGRAGRKRFENEFTVEKMVRAYEEMYG
jgi:glycosyltransferase involved in cell wall biosynthesis